jgi:SAM-dependent methyltransferase
MSAQAPEICQCTRFLEEFSVRGGELLVKGWIFAPDSDGLKDVVAEAVPAAHSDHRLLEFLDSSDVRRSHPESRSAGESRFRLMLIRYEGFNAGPLLLLLKVVFQDRRTCTWCLGHALPRPPEKFVQQIGGAFEAGLEFLGYFLDYAGLSRTDRVLDFGCGTGRMAIPLQTYLGPEGRYVGVDVVPELIKWCRDHLQHGDARFRFEQISDGNAFYHPKKKSGIPTRSLPVDDASVTFAFATSVFTHLQAADAQFYLRELGRTLRPGGRLFLTAYLMDAEASNRLKLADRELPFVPVNESTWTANPALPETATAFQSETFIRWAAEAGLHADHTLPGKWNDRPNGLTWQDALIFSKQ